jgi:hypothetical protein
MANGWRGYPQGDAQERVVFRRYMDVPWKNAPGSGGPVRSAGMRPGCAFFLATFSLHKQRKSDSRTAGARKLFLPWPSRINRPNKSFHTLRVRVTLTSHSAVEERLTQQN